MSSLIPPENRKLSSSGIADHDQPSGAGVRGCSPSPPAAPCPERPSPAPSSIQAPGELRYRNLRRIVEPQMGHFTAFRLLLALPHATPGARGRVPPFGRAAFWPRRRSRAAGAAALPPEPPARAADPCVPPPPPPAGATDPPSARALAASCRRRSGCPTQRSSPVRPSSPKQAPGGSVPQERHPAAGAGDREGDREVDSPPVHAHPADHVDEHVSPPPSPRGRGGRGSRARAPGGCDRGPRATRRGCSSSEGATRAWTSTSSGRDPSIAASITLPGARVACATKRAEASSTSTRPPWRC